MAGLKVILTLEGQKGVSSTRNCKIINKANIWKDNVMVLVKSKTTVPNHSSSSNYNHQNVRVQGAAATSFLDYCFLCKRELLPGKEIYMYKGDKGFCSMECRCKQILVDEEESKLRRIL